jgi:hypothetical protein
MGCPLQVLDEFHLQQQLCASASEFLCPASSVARLGAPACASEPSLGRGVGARPFLVGLSRGDCGARREQSAGGRRAPRHGLCDAATGSDAGYLTEFGDRHTAQEWLRRWRLRLQQEPLEADLRASRMRRANPAVIPRNHQVEYALTAALEQDLGPLDKLLRVLAAPWDDDAGSLPYRSPPAPHEVVRQTFCGT